MYFVCQNFVTGVYCFSCKTYFACNMYFACKKVCKRVYYFACKTYFACKIYFICKKVCKREYIVSCAIRISLVKFSLRKQECIITLPANYAQYWLVLGNNFLHKKIHSWLLTFFGFCKKKKLIKKLKMLACLMREILLSYIFIRIFKWYKSSYQIR